MLAGGGAEPANPLAAATDEAHALLAEVPRQALVHLSLSFVDRLCRAAGQLSGVVLRRARRRWRNWPPRSMDLRPRRPQVPEVRFVHQMW